MIFMVFINLKLLSNMENVSEKLKQLVRALFIKNKFNNNLLSQIYLTNN